MKLETEIAADILAQLGNVTRLQIVRLLVRAGKGGLPVGRIQEELGGIPGSTLSHHLKHLISVGLVTRERRSTVLNCQANYELLESVAAYLMEECCSGLSNPFK